MTQPTCALNTGTITVTSPTGATIEYSIDGTTWVASPVFAGLAANATYTISVRNTDNPTCVSSAPFVIDAVPSAPAAPSAIMTQPTCALNTRHYYRNKPNRCYYRVLY